MAKLQIRTDGDPILRKKSRAVEQFDDALHTLIEDMYETMYATEGVGLAAVQIGKLKRLLVIDDYEGHKLVLINPEIVEKSGAESGIEACLSVPERAGEVERATHIVVSYKDARGEARTLEADAFLARIVQHEMDHLEGILFTDRAEEMYVLEPKEEKKAEGK